MPRNAPARLLDGRGPLPLPAWSTQGAGFIRGYFGIGAERISKPMNLGAVLRTGHAFGASFAFTVDAHHDAQLVNLSDTAKSAAHLPLYEWAGIDDMRLPKACVLIGVELDERAVDLPSFRHPLNAAYLLGPEKGDLSAAAKACCAQLVKIPTKFCLNLSVAAALVMYDRALAHGGFAPRGVNPLAKLDPVEGWRPVSKR